MVIMVSPVPWSRETVTTLCTELADADPWTSLLWTGGRTELPGRPEARWRPHPAPLAS
jgi:hypothetical protein